MDSQEYILVVDDEANVRLLIAEILRTKGFKVETADSGLQAQVMLADQTRFPDHELALIISDLMMPGVSGLEVLATAKKQNPLAEVILVTAFGSIETALEALRQGAHDYITKPFSSDELIHSVQRALTYRRLKLERAELLASLQRQRDDLKQMLEASNQLTRLSSQPDLLVEEIIETAQQHLGLTVAITLLTLSDNEAPQTKVPSTFQIEWGQKLADAQFTTDNVQDLFKDAARISKSYLIDPTQRGLKSNWLCGGIDSAVNPLLMTPLEARSGYNIGLLWVADFKPPLPVDVIQRLEIFANQVGGSLENANLFAAQHRQVHTRNVLVEAGHRIATTLDQQEVLQTVLEASLKVMPQADLALVYYQPDPEAEFEFLGLSRDKRRIDSSPVQEELITQAMTNRDTIYHPAWNSSASEWLNSSLIIEPLVLIHVPLGTLAIISNRPGAFSEDYHQVLAMLANQAAIALQNARLYREAQRADELEALYETGKAISRTLNLQETLTTIMGTTCSLTGASTSNIYLYTPEHSQIDSVISLDEGLSMSEAERRRSAELVSQVMENHQSGPILDKCELAGAADESHSVHSRLVVPLATGDSPVGVLELGSEYPDTFTANDVRLVQIIASQSAVAIQNARLYEEVQQRLQQTEALGVISRSISNTLELSRVLDLVVQSAAKTIPVATHTTLYLFDQNTQTFVPEARFSQQGNPVPPELERVRDQAIQQVFHEDATTRTSWQSEQHGEWSLLIAPLKVYGVIIGAISSESPRPHAFHVGDETLLNTFASHASVAIQNANLFRDLSSAYLDLASKQEEILRNNRTLQALFDGITDGLYIVDRNLRIVAINQAEAKRLDKTVESLIGQTCNASLWGETSGAIIKIVQDTFKAGEERNWESQIETGKRGPFTDRGVRTYPIFDAAGKVSQVIIFAHDVSEQRRLQASLFRSANLAAVGQLASSVAHQINNPLTVIIANTQLMQMDTDPASPDYSIITDVAEAGTQIRQIVQNVLDFSTQESYEWFETDVEETINDALNLVAHSLRKSKIVVEKKIPNLPAIIASASHLKLLWMNLFLNARDAIFATTNTEGKIEIVAEQIDPQHIQIRIRDNGIGIPREYWDHLFHPFFTTKSTGKNLGLGLYACRSIVESHKGQIEIDSPAGDFGTTVTVSLPTQ